MIYTIIILASYWRIFQKMGRQGWEAVIPFYDLYVLFETLYGDGWRCLTLLIPFYNIYVAIKLEIDLCHAFGKQGGFVAGFILVNIVFAPLLAFSDAQYLDGSHAVVGDDPISQFLDLIATKATGTANPASAPREADEAARHLRELDDLRRNGIITNEEFEAKKAEILARF